MKKILLIGITFCWCSGLFGQQIIPAPQKVSYSVNEQPFFVGGHVLQVVDPLYRFESEVKAMVPFFKQAKGIDLIYLTNGGNERALYLMPEKNGKKEAYRLAVDRKSIQLSGTETGIFYGLTSLLQLAVVQNDSIYFSAVNVYDYPQFPWRGLHLDVCRHFFPVDYVKKYIDLMALHKFNTFHWHLTEDQGWRIEIKKYPELSKVGAYRNGTMVGQYRDGRVDEKRYGSFYSQEEIKEVVEYARKRHVTIVPEIEMPGHAVAAIASYPWLSCRQHPVEVEKIWGVFEDVYCAGNDSVFTFLENLLDEVCALFPGEYVHIGGDECPKESWKKCSKCQSRIKSLGLKDEHELQSYFIQRIEKYLNKKGKKIIGWDEILEGGLAPNAAVMSWRGTEGGTAAATQGHKAVLTPGSHCYFDHYQGNPLWEPISIGGFTNVQKVYGFNPVPDGLNKSQQKLILGGQANLWSEYILSEKQMDYMAYPRAVAMAEALWLPVDKKDQVDFLRRLDSHLDFLKRLNVNVSYSHYQPEFVTNIEKGKPGIAVKPTTGNPFLLEFISKNTVSDSKLIEVFPDSLIQTCTALMTEYQWKFISLPGSGKVVFHTGANQQEKDTLNLNFSKASGKKVTTKNALGSGYAKSLSVLTDGITDDKPFYSARWVGFDTSLVRLVIDLGSPETFKKLRISNYEDQRNRVFPIDQVLVEISEDGYVFDPVQVGLEEYRQGVFSLEMLPQKARFIKVTLSTRKIDGTILIDEIWVD